MFLFFFLGGGGYSIILLLYTLSALAIALDKFLLTETIKVKLELEHFMHSTVAALIMS